MFSRKGTQIRRNAMTGTGTAADIFAKVGTTTGLIGKPEFPNEKHMVFNGQTSNFTGPGTNLNARRQIGGDTFEPIKTAGALAYKIDSASKTHDLAYEKFGNELKSGQIQKPEFLNNIHAADQDFIDELKKIPDFSLSKELAMKAIQLKRFAEKSNLIDSSQFSGGGMVKLQPTRQLKKEKELKGGFAPIIMPLVMALASGAASSIVSALIKHLSPDEAKKGQEGAGVTMDVNNKNVDPNIIRVILIHALDNMPTNRQIEIMHDGLIKK